MNESKVIEIIECAGTPYEIGLQYGMAGISFLQESLELCVDTLINVLQHYHECGVKQR
jgi:hypothetical protein